LAQAIETAVAAGALPRAVYVDGGGAEDGGRPEWLIQSERSLMQVWENPADDVFNVLIKK
jgi:hypothetical protein